MWRSPRGPQSCGDPMWPPTQSTHTSFPAVDMAVAAENPASAASGSEASAGHDVIFPFRSWPSVGLVGVQEHTLSGSATARKGGASKRGENLTSASVSRTPGHWPLDSAWPPGLCSPRRGCLGRSEHLLQSSSCLTPNFRVKTSAHYYPNRGNCSSQPLIIKQCFSANLASSPDSNTACLCPRGRSSI